MMHMHCHELQAAAVKAVRQVFETISVPSVIDMVPGGIDKARAKVKVAVPYPVRLGTLCTTCNPTQSRGCCTQYWAA